MRPERRHAGGSPPRLLTYGGRTQSVSAWARELGLSRQRLSARLEAGWPLERALANPAAEWRATALALLELLPLAGVEQLSAEQQQRLADLRRRVNHLEGQ